MISKEIYDVRKYQLTSGAVILLYVFIFIKGFLHNDDVVRRQEGKYLSFLLPLQ